MTNWKTLSKFHQDRIDKLIRENIEPKHFVNDRSGFEWDEPDYTLDAVHTGYYCAECWSIYYNCVCGHDS
jgi:hypothetical protein